MDSIWRTMRPRLLDLFCGAGGAAVGYMHAGFDVYGVDSVLQPNYPSWFIQADALTFPLDGFDVIHASPPCQRWAQPSSLHPGITYDDLLTPIQERLAKASGLTIIENVMQAPLRGDVILCGSMFGLEVTNFQLRRHRRFELNWEAPEPPDCDHRLPSISVAGSGGGSMGGHGNMWSAVMGIDWMNQEEMAESVPPAYTEWIGKALMRKFGKERKWRGWSWTGADAVVPRLDQTLTLPMLEQTL